MSVLSATNGNSEHVAATLHGRHGPREEIGGIDGGIPREEIAEAARPPCPDPLAREDEGESHDVIGARARGQLQVGALVVDEEARCVDLHLDTRELGELRQELLSGIADRDDRTCKDVEGSSRRRAWRAQAGLRPVLTPCTARGQGGGADGSARIEGIAASWRDSGLRIRHHRRRLPGYPFTASPVGRS